MKNLVIDILAPFGMCMITFLALWGKAILGQHKQRMFWRIGVYTGAAASLFSAIGFVAPLEMYPCMSYVTGIAFMSCCILASMYYQPVRPDMSAEELKDLREGKVNFLVQMGIGAGFILFLMVIVSFTTGQQEGRVVNESVASAINRINKEIVSLRNELTGIKRTVNGIDSKADTSAKYDTARMKMVTDGQNKILKQTTKKR